MKNFIQNDTVYVYPVFVQQYLLLIFTCGNTCISCKQLKEGV